jgi:hypothetical protein
MSIFYNDFAKCQSLIAENAEIWQYYQFLLSAWVEAP